MPEEKIIASWSKKDKKVIYCHHDVKIADFEAKDFAELDASLIATQLYDGVAQSQLLSDIRMEQVLEYLKEEFSDFSASEIQNAIHLKIADVLELTDKQKDHYQSWSNSYLTPILKHYRMYRGPIVARYEEERQAAILKEVQAAAPPKSKEQIFAQNKALCVTVYNNFLADHPIIGLSRIYDILHKMNLIPYSEEKMDFFKEEAITRLRGEANKRSADSSIRSIIAGIDLNIQIEEPEPGTDKHREFTASNRAWTQIENKAKELAVRNVFSYMKETETKMEDYFMTHILEASEPDSTSNNTAKRDIKTETSENKI